MTGRRLSTLLSLLALASLSVLLGACNMGASGGGGSDVEPTPTPIPTSVVPTSPTYEVQRGEVERRLQFTGRVAPVVEEELFFRTGGYVEELYVRRNEEVEEGQLLAELEVTDLKNQIIQKEAELTSVQMDYERRVTEAENSVRAAELRLAKLEASNSNSQIVNARINLERAQESLLNAQDEYNKSLARDWESEEARERYAQAVLNAERSLEMAQASYADALNARERTEFDVELAQMDLDLAEMRLAEIETGLEVTRTLLSLQRLQDQLNDARIVAPFAGIIRQLNLMEGRQIQGYQEVLTLSDPTELEISAELQDSEMSELTEGMELVAEFVNRPGEEYAGVIRRLPYPYGGTSSTDDATADEDEDVRIELPNVELTELDYVDIGDRIRMTVVLEREENTLWLPPQAVRTFEGRSFVVVRRDGAEQRVDVRLGIRGEDRVEILEGLEEGDIVVAR